MPGLKTFERRNVAMLDISDKMSFFFVFGTNFVYEISCNDITWSYKLKEEQPNASKKLSSHGTLP